MYRRVNLGIVLSAAIPMVAGTAVAQLGTGRQEPKGKVSLVSSVESIVPGRQFDVAIRFQLASGWHIYWHNSGDSGLPPNVTWSLPDGFSVGDLQYPVPKRNVAAGDIVTNVLDGEPSLLVRITPPAAITVDRVVLSADVQYLICEKICLREAAKLALELPVLPAGRETKPANQELFRLARRALPKEKSKYLSITASTRPVELVRGQAFELMLDVDIKRGFHIQSHEPLNPSFIKCDVFLEKAGGVLFNDAVYPRPKLRTVKYLGKVSEYAGRIVVRVPGMVDVQAAALPRRLGGVFKYQACNDKGTCFPPDALAFSLPIAGDGRAAAIDTSASEPVPAFATTLPGAETPDSAQPSAEAAVATDVPQGEGTDEASAGGDALTTFLSRFGMVGLLIGCFGYGLIINATPCVLPLLSIKVLGFVQQAHESRKRTLLLGLTFGAGVMVFFVVLGFLASAGTNVLQFPAAVIGLGAVVMALALSMLGVYTLQAPATASKLDASIQKEGPLSSFGKGALAPVLGFACTGPLLAGAFGWATQQPPHIAVLAFLFAGLGMASPYMLLGANPNWLSFLPKPGPWMITFERIMGFLLLAMVIWLLHPLVGRIGAEGLEWTLGFLVIVAMACWLLGKVDLSMSSVLRWTYRGGAAALVVASAGLVYGWIYPLDEAMARQQEIRLAGGSASSKIAWRHWSAEAVESAVRAGSTVFVDFTADYCTNCKINKATAIYRPEAIEKLRQLNVVSFQADFSAGGESIFAQLQKYGRAGPPLDLIFPAGRPDKPIVMTPLFSLADLLSALDRAGPSRATLAATPGP